MTLQMSLMTNVDELPPLSARWLPIDIFFYAQVRFVLIYPMNKDKRCTLHEYFDNLAKGFIYISKFLYVAFVMFVAMFDCCCFSVTMRTMMWYLPTEKSFQNIKVLIGRDFRQSDG